MPQVASWGKLGIYASAGNSCHGCVETANLSESLQRNLMCTHCISAAHSYYDWLVQYYGFLLCTSCYCFTASFKIYLWENNNNFLSIRNNNHNINTRTHRCQQIPDRVSGHEWTHKRKSSETNMFAPEKNWPQEGKRVWDTTTSLFHQHKHKCQHLARYLQRRRLCCWPTGCGKWSACYAFRGMRVGWNESTRAESWQQVCMNL